MNFKLIKKSYGNSNYPKNMNKLNGIFYMQYSEKRFEQ